MKPKIDKKIYLEAELAAGITSGGTTFISKTKGVRTRAVKRLFGSFKKIKFFDGTHQKTYPIILN